MNFARIPESQESALINAFHYVCIPPLEPRPGFCIAVCDCKVNKIFPSLLFRPSNLWQVPAKDKHRKTVNCVSGEGNLGGGDGGAQEEGGHRREGVGAFGGEISRG